MIWFALYVGMCDAVALLAFLLGGSDEDHHWMEVVTFIAFAWVIIPIGILISLFVLF